MSAKNLGQQGSRLKRRYFECQGLAYFPALLCKNRERRTYLAQKHWSVLATTSALLNGKLHNTNTGLLSVTVYDDIDHFSRPVNSKKKKNTTMAFIRALKGHKWKVI